jgi:uncharacterized lipoprotein
MNKLFSIAILAALLSACSYNPVQYEQQRAYENTLHSKQMG